MASIAIYSHDRIDLTTGLASIISGLYGNNAIQTLNITRNTPQNAQQAVGYLGVVDYTRGSVTSDVTIDTVMVEGCTLATITPGTGGITSSINHYAQAAVDFTTESYNLTSFALAAAAGSPVTCNYGYLCGTLSSYLATKAIPNPSDGTQFAFVLGDQGLGLDILGTWSGTAPTPIVAGIPIMDASGALTTATDNGIPAGVQSVNMSANVNRDQVIDIRTSRPVGFTTTYPLDLSLELEVYQVPGGTPTNPSTSQWNHLTGLSLVQRTDNTKVYSHVNGLRKQTEGESVSVGRYLAYTVRYICADLNMPIAAI